MQLKTIIKDDDTKIQGQLTVNKRLVEEEGEFDSEFFNRIVAEESWVGNGRGDRGGFAWCRPIAEIQLDTH